MKYKIILTLALVFIFSASCDESILEKSNPNELSTETFFADANQAIAATNAIYASLQTTGLWTREYFFTHDLLSDENFGLGSLEAQRRQVLEHGFDAGNSVLSLMWQGLYRGINRANLVDNSIPEMEEGSIDPELANRLLGEARFLRALFYFELVSLWGDVPFLTEVATNAEGNGRTNIEEIYNLIFEDLNFAEQYLLEKGEYDNEDIGRATVGAAQGLKGKIYLWRGNYPEAETEFAKVITSNNYSLVNEYTDNFTAENENNDESLFEVQFTLDFGGGNRWSGDGNGIAEVTFRGQEYGFKAWRNVIPSEELKSEFEADDPRFGYSFYGPGDSYNNGTDTIYTPTVYPPPAGVDPTTPDDLESWRKYQNYYNRENEVSQQSGINFRVLRFADILLMQAEVKNELDKPQEAIDLLNQVRGRPSVDMPLYDTPEMDGRGFPVGTKDQIFDAIVHERIVELNGEQIRNRDIRRWRRDDKLDEEPISSYNPNRHGLLPIPTAEIDANPMLTTEDQNSGY